MQSYKSKKETCTHTHTYTGYMYVHQIDMLMFTIIILSTLLAGAIVSISSYLMSQYQIITK